MAQDPKARSELKKFVPTFVDILGQVIDYRLPVQYDYHKIPAPFIQMKLLKLFGQIGKNDKE
jgi:AP-4 complex subunit epsilon-1